MKKKNTTNRRLSPHNRAGAAYFIFTWIVKYYTKKMLTHKKTIAFNKTLEM